MVGAVKLKDILSVEYRKCFRIYQTASSQDCSIKVRNWLVLIRHRCLLATKMGVGFLDRIRSNQQASVDHVSDLYWDSMK